MNNNDVEQSVIDEDELQRQLEEELANMNFQPDGDDMLERQSNYSIFNQSQANFNTIPNQGLDISNANMDDYVEKILQKERDRNKILQDSDFRETNNAWKEFLQVQNKEIQEVIPENWNEELEDLKRLNEQEIDNLISSNQLGQTQRSNFIGGEEINAGEDIQKQVQTPQMKSNKFSSLVQEHDKKLDSDELNKIEEEITQGLKGQKRQHAKQTVAKFTIPKNKIKKQYEVPKIVLAEEKLLESFSKQNEIENSIKAIQKQDMKSNIKDMQSTSKVQGNGTVSASINFDQYKEDNSEMLLSRKEEMFERMNVVNQGIKQMQEYELEMERLFMEREDKLSREIEEFAHRSKFIQKDMHPPLLPPYFQQPDNPLKSKPVQRNPIPTAPLTDNFMKYRIGSIGLQSSKGIIDLSKVKILWSREKQEEQELQQRIEQESQRRLQEHQRLSSLLKVTKKDQKQQENLQQLKKSSQNLKESLSKQIQINQTKVSKVEDETFMQEIKIELKPAIIGKDLTIYDSFDQIKEKYHNKQINEVASNLLKVIPSLSKTLPQIKDANDPRPQIPKKSKTNNKNQHQQDMFDIPDIEGADTPIGQALELHAPNPVKQDRIEIKNENIQNLELKALNSYQRLQILNLSMNKIAKIENGILDMPYLHQIRLNDNLIKEIPQTLFSKCPNIKLLHIDINQLTKLQGILGLIQLEDLSVSNNQLSSLEGLQNLSKLRRLNLSFNKLTTIENFLSNLTSLEYLELGKNFISNVDNFPQHKLIYLQELYLYSNQLVQFPKNFQMIQLKVLNLNRNQDLHQLCLGFNPLLEVLSASYCSLVLVKQLSGCSLLRELDLSFNQIQTLDQFLNVIQCNNYIRNLRFNDNPFSNSKDELFDQHLKNILKYLEIVNGKTLQSKPEARINKRNHQPLASLNYRSSLSQLQICSSYRSYLTKIMSQKIRITFFSTTHLMKYCKLIAPFQILENMSKINNSNSTPVPSDILKLLAANHSYVEKLRYLARRIISYFRRKKIQRRALLIKMRKFPIQIIQIQSLMKGHLARVKNQAIVRKIKQDAPKKTRKYQQISKLQANIKGFLFRKRRMRALQKLRLGGDDDLDFQEDFEGDFDADKFFGIKEDVFQKGLSLPQEQMMQQMITMMMSKPNQQQTHSKSNPQQKVLHGRRESTGVDGGGQGMFPPIGSKNNTHTNMNDAIKPKSMTQNQNKNIKSNRPPSARSNAISEIDLNSDSQSQHHQNYQQVRRNNLVAANDYNPHHLPSIGSRSIYNEGDDQQSDRQTQYSMNSNPFYPGAANQSQQSYLNKMNEQKKKQEADIQQKVDEWGFMNEESKKLLEQRYKKREQMKKKKELSAAEKYALIKAQNAKR